jgi:hypothetical protein
MKNLTNEPWFVDIANGVLRCLASFGPAIRKSLRVSCATHVTLQFNARSGAIELQEEDFCPKRHVALRL